MDTRTAIATAIFFSVALVNPRDFPFQNIPLIYPAFGLFCVQMGLSTVRDGFRRVRFLFAILVLFQSYFVALRMTLGVPIVLVDYGYILEPAMILVAAAAAAVRSGGTKAATWMFVAAVTLSAACGIGIYTIGEPFTTIRATLQQSIGGIVGTEAMIRDMDLEDNLATLFSLNAGLSSDVVIFGYQLAAALALILAALLAPRFAGRRAYLLLILALAILIGGIITNTERATVVAAVAGVAAFTLTGSVRRLMSVRSFAILAIGTVLALVLSAASGLFEDRESLTTRALTDEESLLRLYMPVPAILTVLDQPLGSGDLSDRYVNTAYEVGWVKARNGLLEAHSSHNHFANTVMFGGLLGLTVVALLLTATARKLVRLRHSHATLYPRILAAACVASLVHSCFHNAGFFGLVASTQIVFGLFWASTGEEADEEEDEEAQA